MTLTIKCIKLHNVTIKKKYSDCENCGANEYESNWRSNFLKCAYCGTEYEIEESKGKYLNYATRLNAGAVCEFQGLGTKRTYLTQEELLRMGVQPKGFFQEVGDGISSVGSMFDCLKTMFGR